mmetsp:Transcript_3010/g.4044  ORF Transcript_3010/g.4044 Transcript_3010/m.4044 type:complete len:271 (+) Transcript_3010:140-952(+)
MDEQQQAEEEVEEYEEVEYEEELVYDEHTVNENEVGDQNAFTEPKPAPSSAPAGRPAHPLFGGADLAAAASKLRKTDNSNDEASPARSSGARSVPSPSARSAPPKQSAPSGNAMADQAALMAKQRAERMAANGDENGALPPSSNKAPAAVPIFAHAKLRKTPSQNNRDTDDADNQDDGLTQGQLRNVHGGVNTREPARQEELNAPPPQQQREIESHPEPIYDQYEPVQGETKYETTMLSRTEPKVVTTETVIQHDAEYEIVEYKMCCTIL